MTASLKSKSTKARKAAIKSVESTEAVQASAKSAAMRTSSPTRSTSKLVEVASALVAARSQDAQALIEVGRKSSAGFTAVLARQTELAREAWSELRAVAKVARAAGARETAMQLGQLARGSLQLGINGVWELSGLAAPAQSEAFGVLARRAQQNLGELKQLRAAGTAARAAK